VTRSPIVVTPGKTPYHRIRYVMDGRRYSTSCGKTFDQAVDRIGTELRWAQVRPRREGGQLADGQADETP
jgi:hypothetical protein